MADRALPPNPSKLVHRRHTVRRVRLWVSPTQTLQRGGGDCDDLSSLALSLLYAMGLRSADMLVGTYCGGQLCDGHAWAEGRDRSGHFLLETTNGTLLRGVPEWGRAQAGLRHVPNEQARLSKGANLWYYCCDH
jgi:transglutaminase-like putative cysteine protease